MTTIGDTEGVETKRCGGNTETNTESSPPEEFALSVIPRSMYHLPLIPNGGSARRQVSRGGETLGAGGV